MESTPYPILCNGFSCRIGSTADPILVLVRKQALAYLYRSTKQTKERLTPPILASSKGKLSRFPRDLESV